MGVINRGILGGFSGRVANVVGGSWKGIAYMRALPLSVANPNTAAQQDQRNAFSNTVLIASTWLTAICKPLWDRFAQKMSGFNAFIQANIEAVGENPGMMDAPQDFIISRGSLEGADIVTNVSADGSDSVTITWVDNSGTGNALATDEVYIAAFNGTQGTLGIYDLPQAVRSDGTATLTLDANAATGDSIHAWLAFRSADGTLVSDTTYNLTATP